MILSLKKSFFSDREALLAEHGDIRVTAFRYESGVEALRIENKRGYIIFLPFQGQQVWRMNFDGHDLGMQTTIKEPVPTSVYLDTYGGVLYHCGVGCVGVPDLTHPHHGEIPNMSYENVKLIFCCDDNGKYVEITGEINFDRAFVRKYQFKPHCRLYENGAVLSITTELTNLRPEPMEYAYLCHMNFKPIDGAQLIYNGRIKTVHKVVPDTLSEENKKKLSTYMDLLEADPDKYDTVGIEPQYYDPEICCTVLYNGDRGYTMQYKEGMGACYVSHPADLMPYTIRWISRTPIEQSMGMALPSTCEHLGYDYAKANGQMKFLAPNEKITFRLECGFLTDEEARKMKEKIKG